MKKISIKLVFAASILSTLISFTAQGQDTLTTRSGQHVILHKDGSFEVVGPTVASALTNPPTEAGTTDGSVFEIPTQKSIAMTPSQQILYAKLTSTLQQEEVALLIQNEEKRKKIEAAIAQDKVGTDKYVAALKADLKKTKKSYKHVGERLQQLQKLQQSPDKNIDKKLNKIKEYTELNVGPLEDTAVPQKTASSIVDEESIANESPSSATSDNASAASYPTDFKVIKKRPANGDDCTIAFQGKDASTGKSKKEVTPSLFFSFSQPKLKPYFKSDDFLNAEAYLTKLGKDYFLTMQITLRSKDASKSYGSIDLNSEIRLQYIDGDQSLLYSIVQDYGEIEPYSGHTLYTAIYPLSGADVDYMSKKLLDTVGIMWSSGFEQYDIYDVDFLKDQMNCLKNGTYSKK